MAGTPERNRTVRVAYQSLYRKYRPQRFAELVGQDHVTTALRNAVRDGRVGPRLPLLRPAGHRQDHHRPPPRQGAELHEPGRRRRAVRRVRELRRRSPTARSSTSSRSTPRRTAASTRSATCIERVAYLSAGGAKKVYILDEVHMLSGGARTRC